MKSTVLMPAKALLAPFVLGALMVVPAWATTQTVTLAVPGMTCAACPFTVRAALDKVPGVSKTEVQYDRREAKVTYDDTQTNVLALTRATENAGYPSSVKK